MAATEAEGAVRNRAQHLISRSDLTALPSEDHYSVLAFDHSGTPFPARSIFAAEAFDPRVMWDARSARRRPLTESVSSTARSSMRLYDRFRGVPLIQPILYKTVFYTVIVLIARMLGQLVHFALASDSFGAAFQAAVGAFTWRRFTAIQIWIFTCFLIYIYVIACELSALLGEGQLVRLFFRHRSSELRLTRRRHVRALTEISRLAAWH
jgi:hypothetical protein